MAVLLMGEFYIRKPDGDGEHGPFDEGQLNTLAEAGKITLETLFADHSKSNWAPIASNPELKAAVFPEHKKLSLKKGGLAEEVEMLNKPEDEAKPVVTVQQMLAAAEGDTAETRHLKDRQKQIERAAAFAPAILTVIMLLSGLTNVVPRYSVFVDIYTDSNWHGVIREPFAIIGFFDLFLALCLFLNVTSIFPLVRFRAMVGLGFFLFYYWSTGDAAGEIASVCAGLGMFVCTLLPSLPVMLLSAVVGVGGMGYLAWVAWMTLSAAGAS